MANKTIDIKWAPELTQEQYNFMQTPLMVKMLGTVDDNGWPHITFIANNRACSKTQVVFGEFMYGKSKQYIQARPKHAYMFMGLSLPFTLLQIKADFSHIANKGEDIDQFNVSQDMRYSTTMNVFRVFYSNIKEVSPMKKISLLKVLGAGISNGITRGSLKRDTQKETFNRFGKLIFNSVMNPKFLVYIDPKDGYPVILPCFQAFPPDNTQLAFRMNQFEDQLNQIPVGSKIAIYGLTMEFIAQEASGTYLGAEKIRGYMMGRMDIEQIYNSGPPMPGKIYPEIEVLPEITEFE
ncbi:MAG: hypothetical protein EU530_07945 [Promethearchaeota archaeon]|nr:MAG: hypothetical protein EU530_07945 [Candidatus Lokiarchaeota archaeon]